MTAMAATATLQGDEEFEEYNPQAKLIKTLEVRWFFNLYHILFPRFLNVCMK